MKRILLVCLLAQFAFPAVAGKFSVQVVDEDGKPFPGVTVRLGCFGLLSALSGHPGVINGVTDSKGRFVARWLNTTDVACTLRQKGKCYDTYMDQLSIRDDSLVRQMTIKRIHHPCAMYRWHIEKKIPVTSKLIGFDCVACDWVKPYGTGTNTDFLTALIDHRSPTNEEDVAFVFQGAGPNDGFIKYTKDNWSRLKTIYEVPTDGVYTNRLVLRIDEVVDQHLIARGVSANEYLVFRSRTVTNETGKIVSANYGFIGGAIDYDYTRTFRTRVFFNPRPNDRNLEFDHKQRINKVDRRW